MKACGKANVGDGGHRQAEINGQDAAIYGGRQANCATIRLCAAMRTLTTRRSNGPSLLAKVLLQEGLK